MSPTASSTINLPGLVLARICTTAIFMTYPACLNSLLEEWQMSATEAGLMQGAFTLSFALSLLGASFLCDRIGAKRVFMLACLTSAIAALIFALMARSFESGLLAISLVGLSQGGTYTPVIMIVSTNTAEARKNSAIGWVLAGMSAGYVLSIFLSSSLLDLYDYQTAFLATALITVVGGAIGVFAARHAREIAPSASLLEHRFTRAMKRRSRLLTLGYIGHSWELLGMWAWVPAFLAATLLSRGSLSAVELGLWTALALHLSGFISSLTSGYAADRFGTRRILVLFAVLGCLCSASIGWVPHLPVPLLLAFVALYGFAAIGDSAVLSAAMTSAVPPQHLGKALGIRSVLGIGGGAIAPVSFGLMLDLFPGFFGWGMGFSTLAVGGFIAIVCALRLPR